MKNFDVMRGTKSRTGKLLGLIVTCLMMACTAPQRDVPLVVDVDAPSFVYTRYLAFPVPSSGIEAEFNPPVLRWPIKKGKSVLYDVRLSRDSLFSDGVISAEGTPWAMFNPHMKLDNSEWFWQYRVSGTEWSPIQKFVINSEAIALVSPSAAEFLKNIPDTHPRVLADQTELTSLKELRDNPDAMRIVKEAEELLKKPIPGENDGQPTRTEKDKERAKKLRQDASNRLGKEVHTIVSSLCQAWVLTGEERYKQRAIAVAMEVARWDPKGITSSANSDFSDARCMLSMALAFDTFFDDLNAQQRSDLVKAVTSRAKEFYHSWINNQEARVLSGHVWQHILHFFFQTALAMHGHVTEADDWLSFAYELFLARTPILGGSDGGWVEGVSYFRMNMETVIEIPMYIKKYTGFDFVNKHPWYINNMDWIAYHIPPGSSSDGFGDNSEEVFSPGADYVAYAREIARLTGSSLAEWYARECERYERIDLSSKSVLRWTRLRFGGEASEELRASNPEFSSGKLFSDIGLVSMHSNPENTASNLMVAMRSSPFGCYGHFLADQNAFNVLYGGERTFFRTGYKVTMTDPHRTGWYQHTKSNNSVLVDGMGQPYSTEAYGWIREFVDGEQIVYAMGDASQAYSSSETDEDAGVKRFRRHLLLLKPNLIVVYDELEASRPVEWSWLIHSMAKMEIDSSINLFKSQFEKSAGIGRVWSTTETSFILRDTFDVPAINWRGSRDGAGKLKSYEEDQWHLRAITPKVPAVRFLAVIEVSPRAQADDIVTRSEEGRTVDVQVSSWRLIADLDTSRPPSLRISNEGSVLFELTSDATTLTEGGKEKRTITKVPWYLRQSSLVSTYSK